MSLKKSVITLLFVTGVCIAGWSQQRLVVTEQAEQRIVIANLPSHRIVWEWKPSISDVDPAHWKWFSNPSEKYTRPAGL